PFHNEALSRRAALDGPWPRPQSRPYLRIRALPASLPGTDHRTPTTRPHYERDSRRRWPRRHDLARARGRLGDADDDDGFRIRQSLVGPVDANGQTDPPDLRARHDEQVDH